MLKDAKALSKTLRYADYCEIVSRYGYKKAVHTLLAESIRMSRFAFAYEVDGEVKALFGCGYDFRRGGGVPWFVCTEGFVDNHKVEFMRTAKRYIAKWLKQYRYLENEVSKDNDVSIAWLKHVGFTVEETPGKSFYVFHMGGR